MTDEIDVTSQIPLPVSSVKLSSGSYIVEPKKAIEDVFSWGVIQTLDGNSYVRFRSSETLEEDLKKAIGYFKDKGYLYYAKLKTGIPGVQEDYYFTKHHNPSAMVSSGLDWELIDKPSEETDAEGIPEPVIDDKDQFPNIPLYREPVKKGFLKRLFNK